MLKGEEGQVYKIHSYESLSKILDWYWVAYNEGLVDFQDEVLNDVLTKAMKEGLDIVFTKDCT